MDAFSEQSSLRSQKQKKVDEGDEQEEYVFDSDFESEKDQIKSSKIITKQVKQQSEDEYEQEFDEESELEKKVEIIQKSQSHKVLQKRQQRNQLQTSSVKKIEKNLFDSNQVYNETQIFLQKEEIFKNKMRDYPSDEPITLKENLIQNHQLRLKLKYLNDYLSKLVDKLSSRGQKLDKGPTIEKQIQVYEQDYKNNSKKLQILEQELQFILKRVNQVKNGNYRQKIDCDYEEVKQKIDECKKQITNYKLKNDHVAQILYNIENNIKNGVRYTLWKVYDTDGELEQQRKRNSTLQIKLQEYEELIPQLEEENNKIDDRLEKAYRIADHYHIFQDIKLNQQYQEFSRELRKHQRQNEIAFRYIESIESVQSKCIKKLQEQLIYYHKRLNQVFDEMIIQNKEILLMTSSTQDINETIKKELEIISSSNRSSINLKNSFELKLFQYKPFKIQINQKKSINEDKQIEDQPESLNQSINQSQSSQPQLSGVFSKPKFKRNPQENQLQINQNLNFDQNNIQINSQQKISNTDDIQGNLNNQNTQQNNDSQINTSQQEVKTFNFVKKKQSNFSINLKPNFNGSSGFRSSQQSQSGEIHESINNDFQTNDSNQTKEQYEQKLIDDRKLRRQQLSNINETSMSKKDEKQNNSMIFKKDEIQNNSMIFKNDKKQNNSMIFQNDVKQNNSMIFNNDKKSNDPMIFKKDEKFNDPMIFKKEPNNQFNKQEISKNKIDLFSNVQSKAQSSGHFDKSEQQQQHFLNQKNTNIYDIPEIKQSDSDSNKDANKDDLALILTKNDQIQKNKMFQIKEQNATQKLSTQMANANFFDDDFDF